MTAALRITSAPPIDPRNYVPGAAAAATLGLNVDHLTRLCREQLQYRGLAVLTPPPGGGTAQWFVHRGYNPKLLDSDATARNTESDLSHFTLKQRTEAQQRRACVERFRAARATMAGSMADVMARVVAQCKRDFPDLRISRTRLYEWAARYQYPRDLEKLVDARGGDRYRTAADEAWAAFRDLYLHQNQPTIRQCWKEVRRMAAERGWGWCGYDACRRQLDQRIPPEQQAYHRTPAAYKQQLAPFIAQDPESWRAGELWIGDHKQLDLVCRWGTTLVRPWLTTWMDWRTRRVVGWVLSDTPNQTTILAALRHGLMDGANFGGPRCVWIDNGRDYDCWLFHGQTKSQRRARIRPAVDEGQANGIFAALKIEAHFATPFNPNGKARLERWFRTLGDFAKTFDTYTGDGVDTKPERLNEILAAGTAVPGFEAVRRRLADHIAGQNARADHDIADLADGGHTVSPDEAMAGWCDTRRVPADPKALDLLLMQWHRPVTVGRNGLALNLCGQTVRYGYLEPALGPFKALKKADRKPVRVTYDPHDLRTVKVWTIDFRYVCTARMNDVGGMHGDALAMKHVAELNRQKSAYNRAMKHVAEHSITSVLTNNERIAENAARERESAAAPPRPPEGPAALQIIRTPVDGQARQVERDQLRAAVGAEVTNREPSARPLDLIRPAVTPRRPSAANDDADSIDFVAMLREANHAR